MKEKNIFKTLDNCQDELENFWDIAQQIKPSSGEIPKIAGIDIYGDTISFNRIVGGDHIIYVDFSSRYDLNKRIRVAEALGSKKVAENLKALKKRAGILIADVSGHQTSDVMLAAMLHQAFLIGVLYELRQNGEITTELFENINTRFYNSSSLRKFITMIYGEINDDGRFRFINAGHPPPVVFAKKLNKIIRVAVKHQTNFQPIGTLPSWDDIDARRNISRLGYKRKYFTSEIDLMESGDCLFLFTDGFSELANEKGELYFPNRMEQKLIRISHNSAREIYNLVRDDLFEFSSPSDDVSLVVIKKK